ncbi:unnamed protein product [Owenia fusiformis]|uniref:Uncharacterized protein n=1 Tax=Owenia fusiformis TaxID=6347 RepID=A0A8J1UZH1_OWEFU|nr:unnamed protein product [Owenia fusiformis]
MGEYATGLDESSIDDEETLKHDYANMEELEVEYEARDKIPAVHSATSRPIHTQVYDSDSDSDKANDSLIEIDYPITRNGVGANASRQVSAVGTIHEELANEAPDGGWGWMCVLGCAGINFILGGMCKAFGIVYIQLLDKFGASAADTSWVGSLGNSNSFLLSPLASILINRFSVRPIVMVGGVFLCIGFIISAYATSLPQIYLGYGFIYGLGSALCLIPSYVIVSQYFHTKKALATGLASAGSGVGSFVLPLLIDFLIHKYALTGTMIILAGIFLNACVCGALYRPVEYNGGVKSAASDESDINKFKSVATSVMDLDDLEKNAIAFSSIDETLERVDIEPKKTHHERRTKRSISVVSRETIKESCRCPNMAECKSLLDLSLLKEPVFLVFGFSNLFAMLALGPALIYLPALAREQGVDESQRALLVATIGASDGIGRILVGFIFDIPFIRQNRTRFYNANILLTGILYFLCIFMKDFIHFAPLCAVIGISSGTVLAQRAVIASDLLGIDRLASSLGLSSLFFGVGGVIGSPIAGFLTDYFGTYKVAYIFASICACISGAILATDILLKRWRNKRRLKASKRPSWMDPDLYRCSSMGNIAPGS